MKVLPGKDRSLLGPAQASLICYLPNPPQYPQDCTRTDVAALIAHNGNHWRKILTILAKLCVTDANDWDDENHTGWEERQNDTTASLMFPFRRIINYVTSFARLKPGDIIATGTPNGAGARFDPPKFLKEGDVVEVEVPGIGILRNGVKTEVV